MVRFLQRYPALILGIISALIQMLVAYGVHWSDGQTAAVNAACAAVFGVLTAVFLARDQILPAILGLGQAAFTLAIVFGADISQNQVATGMAFVAAVAAAFTHTQVTAARASDGSRVPRESLFDLAA
jgi:nicotinamide riboside transporter PnuC